ncbi:hypothetical protein ACFO3O_19025 [Dokdonia ponticola]|uniref:PRTase-CE domain-containing protein n=1 Tax=Dokdonia ponticola TaxID=2041041 RepID=A0ABV9I2T1_9FLAO
MDIPDVKDIMRLLKITQQTVWKDKEITIPVIEQWLSNFTGEVFDVDKERHIALWLLLNFCYYSDKEVSHLANEVFNNFRKKIISEGKDFTDYLSKVKFSLLGSPSESSGLILYYFRQQNRLSKKYFDTVKEIIATNAEEIIFVDDVSLTGSQLVKYTKEAKKHGVNLKFRLLTLIATERAKKACKDNDIELTSAIFLRENDNIFSRKSFLFRGDEPLKLDVLNFCNHYGLKAKPDMPLGFGNASNLLGFFYNTPDNTLPIFWSEINGWKPIFKRFDKKYTDNYKIEDYDIYI